MNTNVKILVAVAIGLLLGYFMGLRAQPAKVTLQGDYIVHVSQGGKVVSYIIGSGQFRRQDLYPKLKPVSDLSRQ